MQLLPSGISVDRSSCRGYLFLMGTINIIWKSTTFRGRAFIVSNTGKVQHMKTDKIRATHKNSSGYESFTIGNKMYLVHRIVASAFLPLDSSRPQVNHKDGDKWNNHVDNLEWCSKSENEQHSISALNNKRNLSGIAKNWIEPVHRIKVSAFIGNEHLGDFNSMTECAKFLEITPACVSKYVARKTQNPRYIITKTIL